MHSSTPDSPVPALIPPDICAFLGLERGDGVTFTIEQGKVVLHRAPGARPPIDPEDLGFLKLAEQTLAVEWLSEEDEEAFKNW